MKQELIKLDDTALAGRMVKYIEKSESLILRAEYYLGSPCPENELAEIRNDYKKLKAAVRADAEYAAYTKQIKAGSPLYENKFLPSVTGAAAWGFYAPDNCLADKELISALKDGLQKLKSVYGYDYWRILAQG